MSAEMEESFKGFDFIAVHSLSHKFSHPHTPDHEKQSSAEKALHLMDKYKALHPSHQQMCNYLHSVGSEHSAKFDDQWIIAIKDSTTTSMLNDEDFFFDGDKPQILSNLVPLLQSSFVRADFHMLEYYLNKLSLSTQFSSNVYDESSFAKNRYFEFVFYQIICVLYGQFWFHELDANENLENGSAGNTSSDTLDCSTIEKKVDSYFTSCKGILDFGPEKPSDAIDSAELGYYWAIKWCCALIKFKENRFNEFVDSFLAVQHKMSVLKALNLHSEALVFYAIACIATRPFKDLNFNAEDNLVDFYTSSSLICTNIYELLNQLSMGNFNKAKLLFRSNAYVDTIDSNVAYGLPTKAVGTFWDALEVIIDSKVFLLILSMTKYITREKLLQKMGYADAEPTVRDAVSNNMVLVVSVLSLGKSNVYYEQERDRFCNLPIDGESQLLDLQENLAKVDHTIKAEAIATHMRSLLVNRYYQNMRDNSD